MMAKSAAGSHFFDEAAAKNARWLRTLDGDAPLLLIAPHGGHAGPATRALLNPKVNDLHTADITRELARRLDAGAIINTGMDRNRLDLNRLSQLMSEVPWMLELVAGRLERIVARSGRAVVLLIHGWNVIEPRVDLGVGVKSSGSTLLPACGAHVSASDSFINGPLLDFIQALRRNGIKPSFGLRYPGAGANNLLQAFTRRHALSPVGPLRRLAALNARGALEAVQLELSVALRMPGRLRVETIAAIAESFARCDRPDASHTNSTASARRVQHTNLGEHANRIEAAGPIEIVRTAELLPPAPRRAASPSVSEGPLRVGLEFYDSSAQLGAMASFDLGAGAAGARVMAVAGRERIALFTAEGRVERTAQGLTLGPLALCIEGDRIRFDFAGPAVVVEDGTAYLSVERALAKAALHETMELHVEFEVWQATPASSRPQIATPIELITDSEQASAGIFGRVIGQFSIGGASHRLEAVARLGRSLVGIGNGAFNARRMIWAAFPDAPSPHAVEARALIDDDGAESASASALEGQRWTNHRLQQLRLAPASPGRPPRRISAILRRDGDGRALTLDGEVRSFMMLSRPGPAQSRFSTALGFASFRIVGHPEDSSGDVSTGDLGAGMFECSQRSASARDATAEAAQADNDE
jgi:hypothetical protein